MAAVLEKYSRLGLTVASTATSVGFTLAKTGTKLGFGITRTVASTVAGLAGSSVDYVLFGGVGTVGPALGGAASAVISLAEQIALAPILLGETVTSTSLVAAGSSIDILSSFFPGSDEASFSLASFVTLVRREWNDPALGHQLPEERYSVAEIGRALIAWAALQGVTQEWQETNWFKVLREIDVEVEDTGSDSLLRNRRESRIHITSDAVLPRNIGQVITADIGEAESTLPVPESTPKERNRHGNHSSRRRESNTKLKSDLRRLSKMVLAGYGGAGLIFFGVSLTPPPAPSKPSPSSDNATNAEEYALANAVDAAEQEAYSSAQYPAPFSVDPEASKNYSWWNVLLGRHDKEIFEGYAFTPATVRDKSRKRKSRDKPPTAIIGTDPKMPRYWVLTDHGRHQVVLVFRGTMSLNEVAVDLTCDPAPFRPASTYSSGDGSDDDEANPSEYPMPGSLPFPTLEPPPSPTVSIASDGSPIYTVHSGMLRMARYMGDPDGPVHSAVKDALRKNDGYELVLCGHSLGAGVAALIALTWADPSTCLTVRESKLPIGRRVSAYCFAPPCIACPSLSRLSHEMITSFTYSHDVVSRLSLGSVRNLVRAAMWLCNANSNPPGEGHEPEGYSAVTTRALKWGAGYGSEADPVWFLSVRKTLEANMHMADLYPPGRTFWAVRDGDLHTSHRLPHDENSDTATRSDKLRMFEVLDVEKVFDQVVFARDMLSSHLPHHYDRALHELL